MKRKKLVMLAEDDGFLAESIKQTIEDIGADCLACGTLEDSEKLLARKPKIVIADLAIPTKYASKSGGSRSGIALLRKVRLQLPGCRCVLATGQPSEDAKKWCQSNDVEYLVKPIDRNHLERILGTRQRRAFVVHGRDMRAVKKVTSILSRSGIKPIVLMEQPSKGLTIIEKFEAVAETCDLAIVILSPDDIGRLANGANKNQFRARQNVLFELGYFCARLGRKSGAVVLVEFGKLEIPSDLSGVVRIDGTQSNSDLFGILSAELGL